MRSIGCCVLLAAAAPLSASGANPRAEVVFHTAFYTAGDPQWEDAPIVNTFRAGTLRRLPRSPGSFVMIGLDCAGLSPSGTLRSCKVSVEPKSQEVADVGERLAREIRIDPDFARSRAARIRIVGVQVRASNSDVPATSGPCWPPSCTFVPAPPPAPPQPRS